MYFIDSCGASFTITLCQFIWNTSNVHVVQSNTMDHFCHECNVKLADGMIPATCHCFKSYCDKCWERLFQHTDFFTSLRTTTEPVQVTLKSRYVVLKEPVYDIEFVEAEPKCPECGKGFDQTRGNITCCNVLISDKAFVDFNPLTGNVKQIRLGKLFSGCIHPVAS